MQRRKYALLKQPFELDALADVSLTNPVLGDVMYFDGTYWVNVSYAELVDDRVNSLLVAGTNIALTYNDAANTLTIDSTAGGAALAGSWTFDTGTSAADPGNKKIRFNSATLASVTAIYVNDTTNQNFDASTVLGFLASGHRIFIQQKNDATRAALFQLSGDPTDNTGWWTIPVTVVDSGTLMANSSDCAVVLQFGGGGTAPNFDVILTSGGDVLTDASGNVLTE